MEGNKYSLSDDMLVSNYSKYNKRLTSYLGEGVANEIIEELGGSDAIMRASYATTSDTGMAYEGSFCRTILNVATYAIKLNELLPEELRVDKNSIVKVVLLSQIAKVLMFKKNDNEWEVNKRGMVYTFNDLEGALRVGARSTLIAMNAGVKFKEDEFEAMNIMDKQGESDNYSKYYSTTLSMVVRQANEIVSSLYRVKK